MALFCNTKRDFRRVGLFVCPNDITVVKIGKNQGVIQCIQSFFGKLIFQSFDNSYIF